MDTSKQPIIPHTTDHHDLPKNRNDDLNRTTTSRLLMECASAVSRGDTTKTRHLLWMLNELASPYGGRDEKLAYYFSQALLCKATASGRSRHETLVSAAEKNVSFDSVRTRMLKFQEASPWTTFGHVASNGSMLEAFEGESKLHIIDISKPDTMCTQWPTFLESLATRSGETPALRLTVVVEVESASFMKEVAPRIDKFARLMGVKPFEFTVVTSAVKELTKEKLCVRDDEAIAVNCIGALSRNGVFEMIRSLKPKVVTIVEEEKRSTSRDNDFVSRFDECLRFHNTYFDMLEESFSVTSSEKLGLERECMRGIVRVLACGDECGGGRRERGIRWSEKLRESGFSSVVYSHDVVDDVRALLKRYKVGWSVVVPGEEEEENKGCSGMYMAWKEEPVVWASVWKPSSTT